MKSLNFNMQEFRQKASKSIDHRVRAIMAGLSLDELRALVRGDPPPKSPILAIESTLPVFSSTSDRVIMKLAV